jgi:hypothetical protein
LGETIVEGQVANTKLHELVEEFRTVLSGRDNWIDSLLPPVLFVLLYAQAGANFAAVSALILALGLGLLRWRQGRPLRAALGGAAGVALALLVAAWLGRAEGFFLPGIITSGATAALALLSLALQRPLVAWTSHLARRWPREWYWHPQVRPAYSEVTWLWVIYFGLRLAVQLGLFQAAAAGALAAISIILGWPGTIALLTISYLYGTWRLRRLEGPSVDEFQAGEPPPWKSQQRGF